MTPGALLRAKVPIYGAGDAARGFWLKISRSLHQSGWESSQLEPALFYLRREGKLVGMAVTHVDDVLHAGEGPVYEKSIAKLLSLVEFDKDEETNFQYCGKNVKQAWDGTVTLNQKEMAVNIKPIPIAPSRKREAEASCTSVECSMLRGRYGSLSWLQRQTRPDLSFASSSGQTAVSDPRGSDLIECN